MSTINSKALIDEFPDDREAVHKLLKFFLEAKNLDRGKEFPIKRIFDLVSPRSELALAKILNFLVNNGALQKIVRVESPACGGIADFPSLLEIPDVIHDWRRDVDMQVTPDNINIVYKVNSGLDINVN